VSDEEIQDIVITANLTPRKCLGFKTPFQAILKELGKDVQIRFGIDPLHLVLESREVAAALDAPLGWLKKLTETYRRHFSVASPSELNSRRRRTNSREIKSGANHAQLTSVARKRSMRRCSSLAPTPSRRTRPSLRTSTASLAPSGGEGQDRRGRVQPRPCTTWAWRTTRPTPPARRRCVRTPGLGRPSSRTAAYARTR
jgi:hypothetical protein